MIDVPKTKRRTSGWMRGRTVRYSIDLDHYVPLCVSCHRAQERAACPGDHDREEPTDAAS